MADTNNVPQYRILAPCYINDVLYEQQQIDAANANDGKGIKIWFEGIPGPHLLPVNAAARAMVEKFPDANRVNDPLKNLTVIAAPVAAAAGTASGDTPPVQ